MRPDRSHPIAILARRFAFLSLFIATITAFLYFVGSYQSFLETTQLGLLAVTRLSSIAAMGFSAVAAALAVLEGLLFGKSVRAVFAAVFRAALTALFAFPLFLLPSFVSVLSRSFEG